MPRRLALALLAAAAALVLALPGGARPAQNQLSGTVGPGFMIVLRDNAGNVVTHLDPGTYQITVDDRSAEHNFDLKGPGVSKQTDIEFVGTVDWTVTFTDGTYRYLCDAHPTLMRSSFTVGTQSSPPPPPPPPPAKAKRLAASVGPGARIAVRSASGARVKTLKAGSYAIAVADRSRSDNFHLRGPRVNARTGVAFTGRRTWKVRLAKGLYTYRSDRHPALRGSFRVR